VRQRRLDPPRTCLLLFDFLDGHVNKDPETRRRYDPVLANARALLLAARRCGAMVAHAHADHRADLGTTARTIRDTDNRLRPLEPDDTAASRPAITRDQPGAAIVRERG
jgi:nicotinamidase-related amidase